MKRIFFLSLLFCLYMTGNAQSYKFTPTWTVGDTKKVTVSTKTQTYRNDTLLSDTTETQTGSILVKEIKTTHYILEVINDNPAYALIIQTYPQLVDSLAKFKEMKSIYHVNKGSGKATLTNSKEIRANIQKSIDSISNRISKNEATRKTFSPMVFAHLKSMLIDSTSTIKMLKPQVEFLTVPYVNMFVQREVINYSDYVPNPFDKTKDLPATTSLFLKSVNVDKQIYLLERNTTVDDKAIKLALFDIANAMYPHLESMDAAALAQRQKNIEQMYFNIRTSEITKFDKNLEWVTESIQKRTIFLNSPLKGKTKTLITRKINLE